MPALTKLFQNPRRFYLLFFLGACLLTAILYFPALHGTFLWDDWEYITRNPEVTGASNPFHTWFTLKQIDYWPLSYTAFWALWKAFGEHTLPYHLANGVIHAANATLCLILLRKFDVKAALFCALVFLVHPVQVQAVAWIIQLKTLLSTGLLLLSWVFYLRTSTRTLKDKNYLVSVGAFFLSLAAKTSSVFLPVVLLFSDRSAPNRDRNYKKLGLRVLPYIGLAILFTYITTTIYGRMGRRGVIIWEANLLERALQATSNLVFYLKKLALPTHLSFMYPRKIVELNRLVSYVPLVFLGVFGFLLVHFRTRLSRTLFLGIGFYLAGILPALGLVNIPFMRFSMVADHWQYPAFFGFVAALGVAIDSADRLKLRWSQQAIRLLAVGVLISLSLQTFKQARNYQSELALWTDTVAQAPDSMIAWYNLGLSYRKLGKTPESIQSFERSRQLDPSNIDSTFDLAAGYFELRDYGHAEFFFRKSMALDPTELKAPLNLGITLIMENKWPEAEAILKALIQTGQALPEAYTHLALCLIHRGEPELAKEVYKDGLVRYPGNALILMAQKQPN